jgi:hypothetical protein
MTKSKNRRTGAARPERARTTNRTKPKKRDTGGARPQRGPTINRISVHHELLKRRLEGGASVTPELYVRAAEQWEQLPGAIPSRTGTSSTPIRQRAAVPKPTNNSKTENQPS